jgi:D-alanine--poly(phosphoribitol) ligase subunit 1
MKYFYNLKDFFENIAKENSSNSAIIYSDIKYSYGDLNEKSNYFVNYFQQNNLTQGDIVAIASTKSFEDYAVMIACLKSGIAYINIDIENPTKRIDDIFKLCKPKFIFSCFNFENIKKASELNKINYCQYDDINMSDSYINAETHIDADTIAYIMFTSGSTGTPKGVAITHQNLIHLINWIQLRYKITNSDNFANISPMYFDNSVFDFYGALFSGASLSPINKELLTAPLELVKYVDELKCTIWFSVPSMLMYLTTMRVLTKENLVSIRIFTFGGEGYPKSELKKLLDIYYYRSRFINVYGPTECTCICSSYEIMGNDFEDTNGLPPLGTINQNFSYIILTENDNKIGELCLIGPNVGRGYYNDTERTKNNFIEFTNENHYRKNMYKTGDLVEEKNGLLYFKGRVDNQIKHMGYRIELEEIELALYTIDSIEECTVVYKRESSNYGKIIAYIAIKQELSQLEIKNYLKEKIPIYMIPNNIIFLDILPKNQNGKIDRKVLRDK